MSREITISKVLLPLLDQYPSIDIPGLGNFSYRHIPASLARASHQIYPPMRSMIISADLSGDHSIFDLLPSDMTKKELKQLRGLIDFSVNELINLRKTRIDGLLSLVREPNGNLEIVDLDPAVRGHLQYLPIVQLQPLVTSVLNEKTSHEAGKNVPIGLKVKTAASWKTYLWPLLFVIAALITSGLLIKKCTSSEPSQKEAVSSVVTPKEAPVVLVDSAVQIFQNDHLSKYKDILTQEILASGCTIVVGSFSSRNGAVATASLVRSMEYQVDQVAVTAPFRVIIRFDCAEHDLKEYLLSVRSKFEPKAWFLSPVFEIED